MRTSVRVCVLVSRCAKIRAHRSVHAYECTCVCVCVCVWEVDGVKDSRSLIFHPWKVKMKYQEIV